MGGRFTREGTYVHLWLIHVGVWQKPAQYCKAIKLQLKINTIFLKRKTFGWHQQMVDVLEIHSAITGSMFLYNRNLIFKCLI